MADFLNGKHQYQFETLQLHVGQEQADPATDSRAVPIYATTSYVFHNSAHAAARFGLSDAGNIYGRLTNSTQEAFEKRIAALEGGVAALAVASGAAAISYTIQALAQNGDHIVAQKTIYGGTFNLLAHTFPQFGISTTFVNAHDLEELENAIQPIQRLFISRRWATPTAISRISTRLPRLRINTVCRWLSTTLSAHRIGSGRLSTARILWSIRPQNLLAATVQRWAA